MRVQDMRLRRHSPSPWPVTCCGDMLLQGAPVRGTSARGKKIRMIDVADPPRDVCPRCDTLPANAPDPVCPSQGRPSATLLRRSCVHAVDMTAAASYRGGIRSPALSVAPHGAGYTPPVPSTHSRFSLRRAAMSALRSASAARCSGVDTASPCTTSTRAGGLARVTALRLRRSVRTYQSLSAWSGASRFSRML